MTARERDPWRFVMGDPQPLLCEGRGSVLGPDTDRRTRWWEMTLECGHITERTVRYAPRTPAEGYRRSRPLTAVLPAPRRVRCEQCGVEARRRSRETT